jgi:hypothetical protein
MLGVSAGPPRCIEDRFLVPQPLECAHTEEFLFINEEFGGKIMAAMAIVPFVTGALLGVLVVAREIEQRTATLPWSLSGSRTRWLLRAALPLAALLLLLLTFLAFAATFLEAARTPGSDPAASLNDYGLRGPLIVFRGLLAFAIGVLTGALLGRVLPALIVAAVACILAFNVLLIAKPFGMPFEPLPERPSWSYGGLVDIWAPIEWTSSGEEIVPDPRLGIPGERLREIELRESALLAVAFVVLSGVSLLVVNRRRPY